MMKKVTIILAFLTCSIAAAQGISVQGNVLDGASDNAPMVFATVKVKGLDISTETDINGNFELSLMDGSYDLIVDFIGYEPAELEAVIIDNKNIVLTPIVMRSKRLSYDLATIEEQE